MDAQRLTGVRPFLPYYMDSMELHRTGQGMPICRYRFTYVSIICKFPHDRKSNSGRSLFGPHFHGFSAYISVFSP